MLKKIPLREGPYELQNKQAFFHGARLFGSQKSLRTSARCHRVCQNDPPILVQPLLRPFYKPPLQTFGEFVTFFAQICEVSLL